MTIDTYLQDKLNPQQYAAAADATQHSLILAGAGSGKTRTLTYKIANLVQEHNIPAHRILAVTFTNKAAGEMKERLEHISQELEDIKIGGTQENKNTADDLPDFDDLVFGIGTPEASYPGQSKSGFDRIGTFHSVFLKILKREIEHLGLGRKKNFVIYDPNDTKSLTKQIIKQKGMEDYVDAKECKNIISSWKNSGRAPEQAGLHANSQKEEWIFEIYQEYWKKMQEANALDFDDLLLLPKVLFLQVPSVREKRSSAFDHILVDEAQDTNAIQFELMRMMCGPQAIITFIGDDYQSIYGWRGAVMSNFLNLKQRWPDIVTYKLEINYRSLPHIVEAGNAIISKNKQQYDKDVTAHREGEHQIRVFSFADDRQEAIQTIDLITKLKEENDKTWADFVILYRTNSQSVPFEQTLIADGIPYKIMGSFKFFDRAEVKDILAYIKFLINPVDSLGLQRIINTPSRKIGKTSINKIIDYAQSIGSTFARVVMSLQEHKAAFPPALLTKVSSFANLLNGLINTMEMITPAELIDQIIKGTKYEDWLIAQEGKEKAAERMENLGQLVNMAMKFTNPGRDSVEAYLEEVSLMTSADTGEEENDVIRLMSVHSSKGLEFSHVFVVGCEENIFPLSSAKLDEGLLEEERRGMYVAITRAQNHLFLSHANSRYQWGQLKYNPPSRFLTELPDHLLKKYDFSGGAGAMPNTQATFDEGDRVAHKLFGTGTVTEVRGDTIITRFDNPTFGVRKMDGQWLKRE